MGRAKGCLHSLPLGYVTTHTNHTGRLTILVKEDPPLRRQPVCAAIKPDDSYLVIVLLFLFNSLHNPAAHALQVIVLHSTEELIVGHLGVRLKTKKRLSSFRPFNSACYKIPVPHGLL